MPIYDNYFKCKSTKTSNKKDQSSISTNNKCWRECGDKETSYTVGGNINWYSYYGNCLKTDNRAIVLPCNPTSGHISREKHYVKRYMHPNVHCSTVCNSQDMETIKCPLTEEWIKMMCYIYTIEFYSIIKKDEIMPFSATWIDLEIIILSVIS